MVDKKERFGALREGERWDFMANGSPKCPHCGENFSIHANDAWSLYDENHTHEIDCSDCGETFQVESSASWTFSPDEQDEFA